MAENEKNFEEEKGQIYTNIYEAIRWQWDGRISPIG